MTKSQVKIMTEMAKLGIELEARVKYLEKRVEQLCELYVWKIDVKEPGKDVATFTYDPQTVTYTKDKTGRMYGNRWRGEEMISDISACSAVRKDKKYSCPKRHFCRRYMDWCGASSHQVVMETPKFDSNGCSEFWAHTSSVKKRLRVQKGKK